MIDSRIQPIVDDVISGNKTAREYVQEALLRAKSDTCNAVLNVIEDRALDRADEIDRSQKHGMKMGKLSGVPFLAKDNILTFGAPTTASSHMLEAFDAPYQATVIEKLEAEGAICIGKTNLDAFAHGGSTENSFFGPTTNPNDKNRVPGGSSGGSAAAVALDIVPFALGSDTGGSIRQPASYCGVFGLKPTYGSVSRYGVVAMASSTDVVGPITHTAEDAAIVMSCISGHDVHDSTTYEYDFEKVQRRPLRIGLISEYMDEGVDTEVKDAVEESVRRLTEMGHTIEPVHLPTISHALAVYYIVVPAELSSNLARYDGIKYGHRTKGASNLTEVYEMSRSEGFMDENKRRILIGNYVLSSGYYDAYYHKAQSVRTIIINEFNAAFDTYDVLIGPVAPTPAFKLGQNTHDPLSMYLADIMTVPPSLAGLPAVSVPVARNSEGLPIGLQVIGRMKDDARVLSLASELERDRG